jgi:hypothetical protein
MHRAALKAFLVILVGLRWVEDFWQTFYTLWITKNVKNLVETKIGNWIGANFVLEFKHLFQCWMQRWQRVLTPCSTWMERPQTKPGIGAFRGRTFFEHLTIRSHLWISRPGLASCLKVCPAPQCRRVVAAAWSEAVEWCHWWWNWYTSAQTPPWARHVQLVVV